MKNKGKQKVLVDLNCVEIKPKNLDNQIGKMLKS